MTINSDFSSGAYFLLIRFAESMPKTAAARASVSECGFFIHILSFIDTTIQ